MESNSEAESKTRFTVAVGQRRALEGAIHDVNLQSGSDYAIVEYIEDEAHVATLEVTTALMRPEFLFMMGCRYLQLVKPLKLKHPPRRPWFGT